jgi:adenylylsulfate kinase-like enzyme
LQGGPEAVLITGVFGSGKSSVAEEIADRLEDGGLPYGALDLDWLAWASTGTNDEKAEHHMMLVNLVAVVGNYLAAGVRFFVLARAIRDGSELESLRTAMSMPLTVVRLTVPLEEIERRVQSHVTTARQRDDLREAATWIESSTGTGIEDLTIPNDRAISDVAEEIMNRLGST